MISAQAFKNALRGAGLAYGLALGSFLVVSNIFLSGSLISKSAKTAAEIPIILMMPKVHLQPTPVMMARDNDERAPPM